MLCKSKRENPCLSKEQQTSLVINSHDDVDDEIQFKGQTFTFDRVFKSELSQQELYETTAAPMLKSYIEGYNVTKIVISVFLIQIIYKTTKNKFIIILF